jgi:hypothetical protein
VNGLQQYSPTTREGRGMPGRENNFSALGPTVVSREVYSVHDVHLACNGVPIPFVLLETMQQVVQSISTGPYE